MNCRGVRRLERNSGFDRLRCRTCRNGVELCLAKTLHLLPSTIRLRSAFTLRCPCRLLICPGNTVKIAGRPLPDLPAPRRMWLTASSHFGGSRRLLLPAIAEQVALFDPVP